MPPAARSRTSWTGPAAPASTRRSGTCPSDRARGRLLLPLRDRRSCRDRPSRDGSLVQQTTEVGEAGRFPSPPLVHNKEGDCPNGFRDGEASGGRMDGGRACMGCLGDGSRGRRARRRELWAHGKGREFRDGDAARICDRGPDAARIGSRFDGNARRWRDDQAGRELSHLRGARVSTRSLSASSPTTGAPSHRSR